MWFYSDFDTHDGWLVVSGLEHFWTGQLWRKDAVEGEHTESTAPHNHMVSYAKALADLAAKPTGKLWGWGCRGRGGRRRFGGGGSHLGSHLTRCFGWLSWLTLDACQLNKQKSKLTNQWSGLCFCDGHFLKFRQVGEAPDTSGSTLVGWKAAKQISGEICGKTESDGPGVAEKLAAMRSCLELMTFRLERLNMRNHAKRKQRVGYWNIMTYLIRRTVWKYNMFHLIIWCWPIFKLPSASWLRPDSPRLLAAEVYTDTPNSETNRKLWNAYAQSRLAAVNEVSSAL